MRGRVSDGTGITRSVKGLDLKRPPSRTSSKKSGRKSTQRVDNVVQLFPNKKPTNPTKAKPAKPKLRNAAKRLSIHEKNVRAQVSKISPRVNFARRVWIGILAGLSSLVVLVLVAVFSPLLALEKIVVVGTALVPEKSILKDLGYLEGRPLPQISNDEVTKKLSKYELIDSVSIVAVPPHTLRVVITERTAVALVEVNGVAYRYDAVGVQLGRSSGSEKLPIILDSGNPATSKSFSRSINVILSLPLSLLPSVQSIRAASNDNVVLSLRANRQRVLWGDSSQPALKARVLSALMQNYEGRLGFTFDVSSPSQPSVY
jgi:cell division protein FtsQ